MYLCMYIGDSRMVPGRLRHLRVAVVPHAADGLGAAFYYDTMLCYAMLCYTILYHTIVYYAMLYYTILCCSSLA